MNPVDADRGDPLTFRLTVSGLSRSSGYPPSA